MKKESMIKVILHMFHNINSCIKKYNNIQSPFKYIMVNPNEINYLSTLSMHTRHLYGTKLYDWGNIIDGDWDMKHKKELSLVISDELLKEHFFNGIEWEKCKIFKLKMHHIENGNFIDKCHNFDELLCRYKKLDILYSTFEKSKRVLSADERCCSFDDDIFVSIGRNGECFLTHGGLHRLCISRLLNIKTIPVRVLYRHSIWQDKLDGNCNIDHPDMHNITIYKKRV